MAMHLPGSTALRGALLAACLAWLLPLGARAEEWPLVLARRIVNMVGLTVEAQGVRPVVRIGVVYDPRQSHSRRDAEDQMHAIEAAARSVSETRDIRVEIVPVDGSNALSDALVARGLRVLVVSMNLREPEWALVLSLAEQNHIGTVTGLPERPALPLTLSRGLPAIVVFPGDRGTARHCVHRARARLEGVFLSRPLGTSTPACVPEASPVSPAASAPPAPAPGVAP